MAGLRVMCLVRVTKIYTREPYLIIGGIPVGTPPFYFWKDALTNTRLN